MDRARRLHVWGIHLLPVTVDNDVGSSAHLLLWMTLVCA